jgi:hypothetical protein
VELNVEAELICPHCGERFPLLIDTSEEFQTLIEDCTVCCRPMTLTVHCRPGEVLDLTIGL